MTTTDNGRQARSRANQRLRKLTIGTAVLGAVASGVLGWVAAAATDGTTPAGTTALTTTSTPATTTPAGTSTSGASTPTAAVVTGVTGNAHATTGGS